MTITVWSELCGDCDHCGMDMEMEPYCVSKEVLNKRNVITGRDYPCGLDLNHAIPLCNGQFKHLKTKSYKNC